MQRAAGAHALQFVLDFLDALRDAAAVGFELRFARPTGADSAAQARHFFAVPGQSRQKITQLRQFDLHAALAGAGARRENIQNELRAVDDPRADRLFQIALLRGREVVIEDHHVGMNGSGFRRQFLHFALPDQRGRLGARPGLDHAGADGGSRRGGQVGEFFERFLGLQAAAAA